MVKLSIRKAFFSYSKEEISEILATDYLKVHCLNYTKQRDEKYFNFYEDIRKEFLSNLDEEFFFSEENEPLFTRY